MRIPSSIAHLCPRRCWVNHAQRYAQCFHPRVSLEATLQELAVRQYTPLHTTDHPSTPGHVTVHSGLPLYITGYPRLWICHPVLACVPPVSLYLSLLTCAQCNARHSHSTTQSNILQHTTLHLHDPLQTPTPCSIAPHATGCYGLTLGLYASDCIPLDNTGPYDITLCSPMYHYALLYHPVTYSILHG